jgi:hypothetical protein
MTSVEGRLDRAEECSGCIRGQSARGHEPERRLHGRTLAPVGIVPECLYQDLAGLLELWTCLELPNDPACLARLSLDYSLELAEHLLLRHPFVPIALAKW